MALDPAIPGNVEFHQFDWTADVLLHERAAHVLGGLPLFELGRAAELAVVRQEWTQNVSGREDGWHEPEAVELPLLGNVGFYQQISAVTAPTIYKSKYTFRWNPREWNALFLILAEVEEDKHGVRHTRNRILLRTQGHPARGRVVPDENDPLTWPLLPGTRLMDAEIPPGPAHGDEDHYVRRRFLDIVFPPSGAAQPGLENSGWATNLNTLPLPVAEHRAYIAWLETLTILIPGFTPPIVRVISN